MTTGAAHIGPPTQAAGVPTGCNEVDRKIDPKVPHVLIAEDGRDAVRWRLKFGGYGACRTTGSSGTSRLHPKCERAEGLVATPGGAHFSAAISAAGQSLTNDEDIEPYRRIYERPSGAAATGQDAVELIRRVIDDLQPAAELRAVVDLLSYANP